MGTTARAGRRCSAGCGVMSKRRVELGLAEAALLFAALGDETRLALLRRLSEGGPASISVLSANFRVSRQAVTKHLQSLAAAPILHRQPDSPHHVSRPNP